MEAQVSEKNTKSEILKAYEALLSSVQTTKADSPRQAQEEKQRKVALEKVAGVTNEEIATNINNLKAELNSSLDDLLQSLTGEFKKLEDVRAAIAVEKQSLDDLYSLAASTDSLAAMLLAQKEKKESFEKEMTEKTANFAAQKEQWELEKSRQKVAEKDYADDLAKRRKREEEEYSYTLKIKRQKEQDEYDTRKLQLEKELENAKAAVEKEIATREEALKIAEAELVELRKNSANFPAKLEKALKDKETEITTQLKTRHEFDAKLMEKQNEADIRLKDQTISSLQEKIKELQVQLKEYAAKANLAEASVKDIAVKAIESSSKVHMFTAKSEKEGS